MIRTIVILMLIFLVACGGKVELKNSPDVVEKLHELKVQPKFVKDMKSIYFGAPNETVRLKAESIVNELLDKLIQGAQEKHNQEFLWSEFELAAKKLKLMDSEEMDRGLVYMEEIMDIYDIESSEGRLNEWRYGFDPNDPH